MMLFNLKRWTVFLFSILFGISARAQTMQCQTTGSGLLNPPIPGFCDYAGLSSIYDQRRAELPQIIVYVNIHYVGGPNGNFVPSGQTLNGGTYATYLLQEMNTRMSTLLPNPIGSANFLGDSKIRFELYTENLPADQYGGIWYWPDENSIAYPYGDRVINLVMHDEGGVLPADQVLSGTACLSLTCNVASINGALANAKYGHPHIAVWSYARLANHEIMHIMGLCHSFSKNDCHGIDINAVTECNNGAASAPCGDNGNLCNNWTSTSTNMMGYNNDQSALSPCQWEIIYSNILNANKPFISLCHNQLSTAPKSINTNESWAYPRFFDSDIVVETGKTLRIQSCVLMGTNRSIIVRRGARLIVDGGRIASLCKSNEWRGIILEGNQSVPHTVAMLSETYVQQASDPAILLIKNGSEIRDANCAINLNPGYIAWPALQDYWGGLVSVQSSTFSGNRRVAAFMKNNSPDLSFFSDCSITGFNDQDKWGITTWGANLSISNCSFQNLYNQAVAAYDAHISVQGCTFDGNATGLQVITSAPLLGSAAIGTSGKNFFTGNNIGLQAYTSYNLLIKGNDFTGNDDGIYVEGPSEYRITENMFKNNVYGINSVSTGAGSKRISCNDYLSKAKDKVAYSLVFQGNNFGARFDQEEFAQPADMAHNYRDVVLAPLGSEFGWIPNQGNATKPARNSFTIPPIASKHSTQLYTADGSTVAFDYFYNPLGGSALTSALRPKCPSNPLVGEVCFNDYNNFVNNQTNSPYVDDCGLSVPNVVDGVHLKDSLLSWEQQINPFLGSTSPAKYDLLNKQLSYGREIWLAARLAASDYVLSEHYLTQSPSPWAQRTRIGLKIRTGDYSGAQSLIAALPTGTIEEQNYKILQAINMKRYLYGPGHSYTGTEISDLESIAAAESSLSAYAKGLLALLSDKTYGAIHPDEIVLDERAGNSPASKAAETSNQITLAPNPARGL